MIFLIHLHNASTTSHQTNQVPTLNKTKKTTAKQVTALNMEPHNKTSNFSEHETKFHDFKDKTFDATPSLFSSMYKNDDHSSSGNNSNSALSGRNFGHSPPISPSCDSLIPISYKKVTKNKHNSMKIY